MPCDFFLFVLKAGCDVPGENCGAAGPSADGFTLRLLGVGLFLPILPFAAAAASGAAIPFGFLALVSPLGLPHTASEPCSSCLFSYRSPKDVAGRRGGRASVLWPWDSVRSPLARPSWAVPPSALRDRGTRAGPSLPAGGLGAGEIVRLEGRLC